MTLPTSPAEAGKPVSRRLDNGLRVTVVPDPSAPVAGVAVHYEVGFRSEPEGRSGFAHLFEHLMFQGGADTAGDHFQQVEGAGGLCNASTRQDYTDFYDVVPAEALDHVLSLEASRMRAPKLSRRAIAAQTAVVKEETLTKMQRPYGSFPWPLISPVLFGTYPNAHDGYGDYAALQQVTVAECEDFFHRHYAPGNAVLTVLGQVDPDETLDLVERHFGAIQPRPVPALQSWSEPALTARREAEQTDRYAALPAIAVGYRVPDPAVDLRLLVGLATLADVLVGGARPRLEARMREAGCVVGTLGARCGLFDFADARDPDMWIFTAVYPPATPGERVLEVFDTEVRRVAADGPGEQELARVRNRRVNVHHRSMGQIASRVRAVGRSELLYGDPALIDTLPERYAQVGADDVAQAAHLLAHDARAVLRLAAGAAGGELT